MADQALPASLGLPEVGTGLPSLGGVPDLLSEPATIGDMTALEATDEETALKSQLMDDIFGAGVASDPPASDLSCSGDSAGERVGLPHSFEGELGAQAPGDEDSVAPEVLESVGLDLEDALSDMFDHVETPSSVLASDGDGGSEAQGGSSPPASVSILLASSASPATSSEFAAASARLHDSTATFSTFPEAASLYETGADSESAAATSMEPAGAWEPRTTGGDDSDFVADPSQSGESIADPTSHVGYTLDPAAPFDTGAGSAAFSEYEDHTAVTTDFSDDPAASLDSEEAPEAPINSATKSAASASTVPPTHPEVVVADDDDDIVVLDEVMVPALSAAHKRKGAALPGPPSKRRGSLLGPLCKRRPMLAPPEVVLVTKGKLRGPACKRADRAELGPPSSRMPRPDGEGSSSEDELSPEETKKHVEARRLASHLTVSLRLNNVCTKSSMTARQWDRRIQQRRESRKKYWEDVRAGRIRRPTVTPQARRGRVQGKGAASSVKPGMPASRPMINPPASFAATKQLMNLINRGTLQMTSVGGPAPSPQRPLPQHRTNGVAAARPGSAAAVRPRAPMVSIPSTGPMAWRQRQGPQSAHGRGARGGAASKGSAAAGRGTAAVPNLANIPELGDKQRNQLLKLLQGNNGASISAAAVPAGKRAVSKPPPQQSRAPAATSEPSNAPTAAKSSSKPKSEEVQREPRIPSYCRTTTGSPDDLFSVYLVAKQDPKKVFVNMQIDNHCLKLRLPARPKTCGMVFAQATRASMEPLCIVRESATVFVPPGPDRNVVSRSNRSQPTVALPTTTPERAQHQCSKCSQKFVSMELLNHHFKVYHAGPTAANKLGGTTSNMVNIAASAVPHDCPLCNKWSGTLALMRHHIAVVHNSQSTQGFFCGVCRKVITKNKNAWVMHVVDHARPTRKGSVVTAKPRTAPAPLPLPLPLPIRKPPPEPVLKPSLGQRHSTRAAAAVARKRSAAAVSDSFPCPNCDAVFDDVSQFPEHWIQAHSAEAAISPSKPMRRPAPVRTAAPAPTRAPAPVLPQAPVQRRVPPRFSVAPVRAVRHVTGPRKPAVAAAPTRTTGGGGGSGGIRCSRCGESFAGETAYAQHWIKAHTNIRLSADQQAAAERGAASAGANKEVVVQTLDDVAAGEAENGGNGEPDYNRVQEEEADVKTEATGDGDTQFNLKIEDVKTVAETNQGRGTKDNPLDAAAATHGSNRADVQQESNGARVRQEANAAAASGTNEDRSANAGASAGSSSGAGGPRKDGAGVSAAKPTLSPEVAIDPRELLDLESNRVQAPAPAPACPSVMKLSQDTLESMLKQMK